MKMFYLGWIISSCILCSQKHWQLCCVIVWKDPHNEYCKKIKASIHEKDETPKTCQCLKEQMWHLLLNLISQKLFAFDYEISSLIVHLYNDNKDILFCSISVNEADEISLAPLGRDPEYVYCGGLCPQKLPTNHNQQHLKKFLVLMD